MHCLITPSATSAPGTWGAYRGAPLPHLNFAEGGQSSTGSLVRWVRDLISSSNGYGEKVSYEVLDEEAANDEDFAIILASQRAFSANYAYWKRKAYLPRDF